MWEIISTASGVSYGYCHSLEEARTHVFNGGFFAKYRHSDTYLVLDPRGGRVATLYL